MHRVLLEVPEDMEVDHINRNKLDNRRCNLRACTKRQNTANIGAKPGHQYKGISVSRDKYLAHITVNKRTTYLGSFDTDEEAATAYDRASWYYFKEFAYLNFPAKKSDYQAHPFNPNAARPLTGKYRGVCWHVSRRKWVAYLTVAGKRQNLGYFVDPEEAARVRDAGAIEKLGAAAKLNFPAPSVPRDDMRQGIVRFFVNASQTLRLDVLHDIGTKICLMCGRDLHNGQCTCQTSIYRGM